MDMRLEVRDFNSLYWLVLGTLFIGALLVGCGTDGAVEEYIQLDESVQRLRLSDEPILSIGGEDERDGYRITQVLRAMRMSDGTVAIADQSDRAVRYYDQSGSFIRAVGGPGQGPGELEHLTSAVLIAGDTVVTFDRLQQRIIYFPPDGSEPFQYVLTELNGLLTDFHSPYLPFFPYIAAVHALSGGQMLVVPDGEPLVDNISRNPVIVQDTLPVYVVNQDLQRSVALGSGRFPRTQLYFFERRGRIVPGGYGERLAFFARDTIVYVAATRDSSVRAFSATGDFIASIELPVQRRELSSRDRQHIRSSIMDFDVREAFDAMPLPPDLPTISDLRASADGDLWVQLFRRPFEARTNWLIFEPNGQLRAALEMAGHLRVVDVGRDYVVVVVTDNLGRESVQMFSLVMA